MPVLDGPHGRIAYEQRGDGADIVWVSGGGDVGETWHEYQTPAFPDYRNTTFDNRGAGATSCDQPLPWTIADFARDTAALIEAVCDPPVAAVGLSMGAGIVQQLAIDRPDLVRCAIAMGTIAKADGWVYDYMKAEIDHRRAGGALEGMLGATHYLAFLYPAQALGDAELYPRLLRSMVGWLVSGENERSLIGQWDACTAFDCVDGLTRCEVPLHVFAFGDDLQAPPQYGRRVAELAPKGRFHLLEGLGHCSLYGHAPDRVNAEIRRVIEAYRDA